MSRGSVEKSGLRARLFSRERVERSERGDTMIEVLLALMILGLTSVALIVAFSTTLSASAQHRRLTSANIAINDYSQQVIAGIEANQNLFTCPTPARSTSTIPTNVGYYVNQLAIASTAPYSPTISNVQYWDPSTSMPTTSCIANASELITVSVSSGYANQTSQFVVDSPTSGSNFVGGTPSGLAFTTPAFTTVAAPISASSGASLPVNPVVEVLYGASPDATDLSPINLTLGDASGAPTSLGTLSGCSSNDINGIVTYTGCTISLTTSSASAVDFRLVATDGANPSLTAMSQEIAVSGSTSSFLSFTTQPKAGYSGSIMSTEPVITAYTGGTTPTVDTTVKSITLTTSGSVSGSNQLSSCGGTTGNSTTSVANGVVTVSNPSGGTFAVTGCDFAGQFYYDSNSGAVGTPYTMTASGLNVTSATSQPFAATGYGAAAQMEFIAEPTGGIASTTAATTATMNSFQVAIEDSWGNTLSGQGQAPYAGSISVAVTGISPALTCTPSASQGIFTFTGCSASIGSNLTLTATATGTGSTGVTPLKSSAFNNTGPVASLVWYAGYPTATSSAQPVAGASGSVMTNQPVLAYEDAGGTGGNGETGPTVVTAETASVTFTSTYASGTQSTVSPNGVLTTCSHLPPIAGIISAGNCTFVGLVGTNYTMSATTTSGTAITSPNSSAFSPSGPGPASQLAFAPSPGVEPFAAAAGSPFTIEPVALVEDSGGNIVASASTQVEMNSYLYDSTHPNNPSVQGGSLLNCSTLPPYTAVSLLPVSGYLDVEGSCAFGGTVGALYQLVATAPGLTSAVSSTFTPTTYGPISAIAVSGCSTGVKWSNPCVLSAAVQDAWGNTVTSFSSGITFTDVGGNGTVSGLGLSTASGGIANITVTGTVVGPELVTAAEGAFTSPQYSFNVIPDTTTATVSESPTSVVYGHESSSTFRVTVVTGNLEALPTTDNVTVNVGGGAASCVVAVVPAGTGGTGTCTISNPTALAASATPYAVTATYGGDTDLSAAAPATAATGLTVTKDSSTATVSESPTSVVYGHESSSIFRVTVVTGNLEALPTTDNVTVNVGGAAASCVVPVVPAGTGGTGTCTISNSALAASVTPYAVTATYGGDTSLTGSALATAATALTVTKDTSTATVSESPTSVVYGHESSSNFRVTVVTGNLEALPTTDNVTVNVGGAAASCVVPVVPAGTGGTGTCTISNSALAASGTPYAVTATYGGDTSLSGTTLSTAATGLTITQDTTTATVSESPTNVVYGLESSSTFRVTVVTGNLEALPTTDHVTVNIGGGAASCVVAVAPAGTGGTGTCTISNPSILAASGTPYAVTATYGGDTDLTGSALATAATGLTVTKAPSAAISWSTPASISYGTLLSVTQLNATDSTGGTFVYTPASGALLTVGSQTLSVTFTPTNSTDYATATATVTLTVTQDTSTVTVTESQTSVTYGSEASSTFTVDVNPAHGENLTSAPENVTVKVGSATCVAAVAATTTGTCTISSFALPPSTTPYVVTTMYPGDTNIAASATATAATGLTVTKFTPTVTVANTTVASTGNLSLTATVGGTGTVAPSGTVTWAVTVNGTAYTGCSTPSATTLASVGSTGSSTATCTISGPAMATYLATATYNSDSNYSTAATAHALGMYVGNASALSTTAWYYKINASTGGSTSLTGLPLAITSPITVTGLTGLITSSVSTKSATFTLGTGLSTFAATLFTCSVSSGTTCTSSGSGPLIINASSGTPGYIDLQAQSMISSPPFVGYWVVTFTQ